MGQFHDTDIQQDVWAEVLNDFLLLVIDHFDDTAHPETVSSLAGAIIDLRVQYITADQAPLASLSSISKRRARGFTVSTSGNRQLNA